MPPATHGTRIVIDDRDQTAHTVQLTAPAGTKQLVQLKNPELGTISVTLWPFPVEARRPQEKSTRTRRLGH